MVLESNSNSSIVDDDENDTITSSSHPLIESHPPQHEGVPSSISIKKHFRLMSILFAVNHGCTVSVLGLSNAKLGSIGVWQSGVLYASYTMSAIYGSSYVVKKLGSRNGLVLGMCMSASYVTSFFFVTLIVEKNESMVWLQSLVAICGAFIGGIGSSILWVSQGTYYTSASQLFASLEEQEVEAVTGRFGGNFAFIFLLLEVILRLTSTVLIETAGLSWKVIFGLYSVLSIVPVFLMMDGLDVERCQHQYNLLRNDSNEVTEEADNASPSNKVMAALNLLRKDAKTKYLAPVNILFGLSTSFSTSVLNGEVIQKVLVDPNSTYVGLYTAIISATAAGASLLFGRLQSSTNTYSCGKEPILTIGALSYLLIALQFLAFPDGSNWTKNTLINVYILLGIGRATYEGTLRAVFADLFPNEKEGAFGNIILFSGSASTLGFVMSVTSALECQQTSKYCLEFTDGSLHNVLVMELLIIVVAIIAMPSFWRAIWIYRSEQNSIHNA